MRNLSLSVSVAALVCLFGCLVNAQDETKTVDFKNDIKPILESNCVSCHSEKEPEGGYRVDIRDEALEYVESGDAEASEFYEYLVTDDEDALMPPADEGGPLDDSDIRLIKTWINEGASWPAGVVLQDPESIGEEVDPNAVVEEEGPNVYRAIGTLHPAAIHLPLGLLFGAGLFGFLSLRGNFVMSDCAYYCLWLGTLGAIIACLTGWWFTLTEFPQEAVASFEDLTNQDHKLFWHRTSALVVTVFALLLALFASSARNRDPDDGVGWKLGAMVLALGIALVGHQGGELTWKASHYDELKEIVDEYVPGLFSEDDDGEETVEDATDPDPNDELGDESAETGGSGDSSGDIEL